MTYVRPFPDDPDSLYSVDCWLLGQERADDIHHPGWRGREVVAAHAKCPTLVQRLALDFAAMEPEGFDYKGA